MDDRSKLIQQHMPLVMQLARVACKRVPANVEMDDLVSVGMLGLYEAIHRYKDDHGASFATYATCRINGAILDELRREDKVGRNLRAFFRRLAEAKEKLRQLLHREPRPSEIAGELGMTLDELREKERLMLPEEVSLVEDYHSSDDDDLNSEVVDIVFEEGPDDVLGLKQRAQALLEEIDALPDRQKFIITTRYGQGVPLKDIAITLGISQARVSQIEDEIVVRLRKRMSARGFDIDFTKPDPPA